MDREKVRVLTHLIRDLERELVQLDRFSDSLKEEAKDSMQDKMEKMLGDIQNDLDNNFPDCRNKSDGSFIRKYKR